MEKYTKWYEGRSIPNTGLMFKIIQYIIKVILNQ